MIAVLVSIFFILTPNIYAGNQNPYSIINSLPNEVILTIPIIETPSTSYLRTRIEGLPIYSPTKKVKKITLSNKTTENRDFIRLMESCSNKIQKNLKEDEIIPLELLLSQSILESNWGKSRFAIEGNNFFGMRTWNPKKSQLKPLENPDADFGLVVYKSACDSVADYIHNLNTSDKYANLREIRKIELTLWGEVDSLRLANGLKKYSEQGSHYIEKVKKKILILRDKKYKN